MKNDLRLTFILCSRVKVRKCRTYCFTSHKKAFRYAQQTKRRVVQKRGRARTIPVITGVLIQVVHLMEERRLIQVFICGCKVSSFTRIQDQSVNLNYEGSGFNRFPETKTFFLNDITRSVLYENNPIPTLLNPRNNFLQNSFSRKNYGKYYMSEFFIDW